MVCSFESFLWIILEVKGMIYFTKKESSMEVVSLIESFAWETKMD